MTMTRKIALGLSLAASVVAGAAYAEQGAKGEGARGDRTATRAEVQTKAQERFARMDVNKDGKLDQADRAARRTAMFDRIDADKSGQISRAEFDAAGQRGPRGPRGPEAADGRDGRQGGPGMHRWGGRGHGRGYGGGMMGSGLADANKDGAVTQAEFTAAALSRFDSTDANKDGTVTREERQAARKAARESWQQNRAAQPAAPKTN